MLPVDCIDLKVFVVDWDDLEVLSVDRVDLEVCAIGMEVLSVDCVVPRHVSHPLAWDLACRL